jgi:carotenoid cleavage dioxygenase-like enzyme
MTPPIPKDFRLMGPFSPMRFEANIDDCVIAEGEVPVELNGGFYRVGPTWKRPTVQGLNGQATQDGMVQALIFREGRVDFRNRWIRTPKYLLEEKHGRALFEWEDGVFDDWRGYGIGDVIRNAFTEGVPPGTNIVNVFPFGGQILTSGEIGAPPIALDPITLETLGVVPWSVKLSRGLIEPGCFGDAGFTAHPKWDPRTGELFGWTYRDQPPYATLHWVKPDGTVRSRELWDAPYATNAHDMWLTEDYVILPFQGFFVDRGRIREGLSVFGWNPELPIVLALIPRDDLDGDVRWIETDLEAQYVMHTMSSNTHDGTLVLDGPIFDRPPFPMEDTTELGTDYIPFNTAVPGRWVLDLETGKVKSERLDDRAVEFPKVDERFYGMPYQNGFLVSGDNMWGLHTIVRRNVITGEEDSYDVKRAYGYKDGDDRMLAVFEPTFAPRRPDAPEGDGYLIVPVSRFMEHLSDYLLFDTKQISAGPIARIELPFQIGWTPHGHWMDFQGGTPYGEVALERHKTAVAHAAPLPEPAPVGVS